SVTDALRRFLMNEPAAQFQTKELPGVEHLVVKLVSPAMQPIGFIASRYLLIWNELWLELGSKVLSFGYPTEIIAIGHLKESPLMSAFAGSAVVLNGEEAMLRRSGRYVRVFYDQAAL